MTGQQFLQALLEARRLNPNSMGEKAGNRALQSTAARFLGGMQSRPSTMQPIADFFGVDVGGFFDPDKARSELHRLGLADTAPAAEIKDDAAPYKTRVDDALDYLANALNALPDNQREAAAERLQVLAMAPDSKKALDAVRRLLGGTVEAEPTSNAPLKEKRITTALRPAANTATSSKRSEKV